MGTVQFLARQEKPRDDAGRIGAQLGLNAVRDHSSSLIRRACCAVASIARADSAPWLRLRPRHPGGIERVEDEGEVNVARRSHAAGGYAAGGYAAGGHAAGGHAATLAVIGWPTSSQYWSAMTGHSNCGAVAVAAAAILVITSPCVWPATK
jgi:hypothetical protein